MDFAYNCVEISLHELLIQINLVEHARPRRVEHNVHVIEAGDVLVSTEVVQQAKFTQASLCENLASVALLRWACTFLVKTLVTFLTAQVSPVWW